MTVKHHKGEKIIRVAYEWTHTFKCDDEGCTTKPMVVLTTTAFCGMPVNWIKILDELNLTVRHRCPDCHRSWLMMIHKRKLKQVSKMKDKPRVLLKRHSWRWR